MQQCGIDVRGIMMVRWTKGYTQAELDDAQHRFDLVFPPDLVALLREKRPIGGHDWRDEAAIRRALDRPFDGLLTSVEDDRLWWPEWGTRPSNAKGREQVLREVVAGAPRLIPLIAHRYLPAEPCESGNPVLSIYYIDAIYYGVDLLDYFERESNGWSSLPWPNEIKHIPFWSDLVQRFAEDRNRPE
jgi:hypothetical protein